MLTARRKRSHCVSRTVWTNIATIYVFALPSLICGRLNPDQSKGLWPSSAEEDDDDDDDDELSFYTTSNDFFLYLPSQLLHRICNVF